MYESKMKYCGSIDSFDHKLTIFHDLCGKADIPRDTYAKAFSTMLHEDALDYFYDNVNDKGFSFEIMCDMIKSHFETEEHKQGMMTKWNTTTLKAIMAKNEDKSTEECLELVIKELRSIQRGLAPELRTEQNLRDKLINACNDVESCVYACLKPAPTLEGVCSDLHSSIIAYKRIQDTKTSQTFYTDRKYRQNPRHYSNQRDQRQRPYYRAKNQRPKSCFVCQKEGCWSTKHTPEERERSTRNLRQRLRVDDRIKQYIVDYEGEEDQRNEDTSSDELDLYKDLEALILEADSLHDDPDLDCNQFVTTFGAIDGRDVLSNLADQSTYHMLTKDINTHGNDDPFAYTTGIRDRYTQKEFYGIMIDTGASNWSTAGYGQYLAYKKHEDIELDESKAGAIKVQFGIGSTSSVGVITINTPVGYITFHIVNADTPFLLCLRDMDRLGIYFDNTKNMLIQGDRTTPSLSYPIVRRFGHPFLVWQGLSSFLVEPYMTEGMMQCYLTDTELRQLHRRFGHPSANRLIRLLERSGHDVNRKVIDRLTRFCHSCQMHGKSPGRFKFTLRDNVDFNHSVYIDVMYIDNQPLLHVVDEGTRFQAAHWLRNMTAQHTWDILRRCWIDVYIGPPDLIIHDAGTNFASHEFQQYSASMAIKTKSVPVEAHQSMGIVERYHAPLRRAYQIITEEMKENDNGKGITKDMILQMAIKAINDTAGPDGIVPTLLVFGTYPRMSDVDAPTPTISQRAMAIKKAMLEVEKMRATRQVTEALRQRNGPRTDDLHNLPINSDVLVWRTNTNGDRWTGPYKLLKIEGETCRIQLPSGPTTFRTTVVKPYLTDSQQDSQQNGDHSEDQSPCESTDLPDRRNPARNRQLPARYRDDLADTDANITFSIDTTPFMPDFSASRQKELNDLIEKGVFEIVRTTDVPKGSRIFNSRFVDLIKHIGTDKAFEKSRLVVQAYNDEGKKEVLTQAPTLQRVSQRIVLSIAAVLNNVNLYLRDISQAYVQSTTRLNRTFFIRPPPELCLPEGSILQVVRPLYGIPEAGNHWFKTYHSHHINQLEMIQSTYDPCLLYKPLRNQNSSFGVVGLQTDDTLFVANKAFIDQEQNQLQKAKFLAKDREMLSATTPLSFNGMIIKLVGKKISITQSKQAKNIKLLSLENISKDQYVAQRARGAYIASVCQPEAAFDLSFAAQVINPLTDDARTLNKRLQWQLDNHNRGLEFVSLDFASSDNKLQIVVFTDSSFANNSDYSSQIGFVIVMTDGKKANVIHWSSVKCKRVTRSVLASELYAMALGFDVGAAIKATLQGIFQCEIPLVLCTDSRSLYDCLVKLGTTHEKRLMIDLMHLRQSYERREIAEVKWIDGNSNPADAMTKQKPCNALKKLIDTNEINIDAIQWVERTQ
jgi:hypothetical protein